MVATSGPAQGHLLVHGGGRFGETFKHLFQQLAGGQNASIVYIPTSLSDEELEGPMQRHLDPGFAAKLFGVGEVTVLHTRDSKEADTESFVKPILSSSAVFFVGGRQWRLADSYLNTRTHRELEALLSRGGVVAGSSAGAIIQGSLLIRGHSNPNDNTIMLGDHQEGFGLIDNIAIDVHVTQQGRQQDLVEVLTKHPEVLGVGIDEDTALHVQGKIFTILGDGHVFLHDGTNPSQNLEAGQEYDMERRRLVSPGKVPTL